jgi:hypothetical protein
VKTRPLESVIEAVLPLGFASEHPEVPFGAKGTCFLVRCHGVLWVVAAKHSIGEMTGYCRVPRNADSLEWLDLGWTSTIDAHPNDEDSAYADLTVIRVLTGAPDIARPIDLDDLALTDEASIGDVLVVPGFPVHGLTNEVQYGETTVRITRQRFVLEATYEGLDSSQHLHIARVGLLGHVRNLDGMSGSPVFLKHKGLFLRGSVVYEVRTNALVSIQDGNGDVGIEQKSHSGLRRSALPAFQRLTGSRNGTNRSQKSPQPCSDSGSMTMVRPRRRMSTSVPSSRSAFGKRTAWLPPDQKTRVCVSAATIRIYNP